MTLNPHHKPSSITGKNEEGVYKIKGRTWYGGQIHICVGKNIMHRAGFGKYTLPHPPVMNLLLRYGLPRKASNLLAAHHELGHLEALPWELTYGIVLFGVAFFNGHTSWLEILLLIISFLAFSELCAEATAIYLLKEKYSRYYYSASKVPRVLFWVMMSILTVVGWFIIFFS